MCDCSKSGSLLPTAAVEVPKGGGGVAARGEHNSGGAVHSVASLVRCVWTVQQVRTNTRWTEVTRLSAFTDLLPLCASRFRLCA